MTPGRRLRSVPVVMAVVASIALAVGTGLAGPVGASNDTQFDRQWALAQIRAPQAWARSTGSGITIGIVDTGVDAGHPDLVGKVLATADCLGRPCVLSSPGDPHGHGTIVGGIAAAVTNNGIGIAGVAPDARLVVARVLNGNGEGRAGDINNGIRWVVDQGARVVNLSLGDPDLSVASMLGTPLRSGIEYAWSKGA
ncbi:MAG: S8 family serine peptidase, partial [Actinomycetota bacterium]|nr:S8 family serine peptidase [Actinomycetota bacterium]